MPLPIQNDFLRPFLEQLASGEILTRSQLREALIRQFKLTPAQIEEKSGPHNVLTNRLAWCDSHFGSAGFVEKWQHPTDRMQDTFRITSLGLREVRARFTGSDHLTVGYLQGFARSSIHRGAGSDDMTSEAERELYEALEALTGEYTIFHSVRWIAKYKGTVGEVDFIIAHPQKGVLLLEVKGGQIQINAGQWSSTDRAGKTHEIKDPCTQAERNRRSLAEYLKDDSRTKNFRYRLYPAVAVPDVRVDKDIRPDCTASMFIDMSHVGDLKARIESIFAYWHTHSDGGNQIMDGQSAVNALVDLLVPTRQLQPKIADIFERERRKIEQLTQQQFKVLKQLQYHKRAAIVGGAGTGKTMLAMEKAQQLLNTGHRVLFLCYNRNLKDWLERHFKNPNLTVDTFHSFLGDAINWTRLIRPPKPADFYAQAAELMADAAQILQNEKSPRLFDALIVDEAQDFDETWWLSLPDLLKDPKESVFYVFFDDNQRIYQQISNIPIQNISLALTDNCRNTQHIHTAMGLYARYPHDIDCEGPEGRPVEVIPASTMLIAKRELQSLLHRLVNVEGVRCEEIMLLTGVSKERSQWKQDEMLGNFVLSWDLETEMERAICVSSIGTYKGLETSVVILAELSHTREDIRDQMIYVGLSRARNHVVVIGDLPKPTTQPS